MTPSERAEENKRVTAENVDFRVNVGRVNPDVDQKLKEKEDKAIKLRADLEESMQKFSLASTKVERLADIN